LKRAGKRITYKNLKMKNTTIGMVVEFIVLLGGGVSAWLVP
jgi:hypothetical protein